MTDRVRAFADRLARKYDGRVTGTLTVPARPARHGAFPENLSPGLIQALQARGIEEPYSHQVEAWEHVRAERSVVLMTPTASGKSLCYNVPVIDAVMRERAKALYLFPTKALSQDQVAEIIDLGRAGDLGVRAFTFDGDTPGDARVAVRTRGDIVVTNPDMLHQGILPHHTKWAQFFEALKFVVVDELHTYRGVFGSHVSNVLRRLRRICRFYGVDPIFIGCSATLANPQEHARSLFQVPVSLVAESGAPQGEKMLMLWNPPVVNPDLGIRASARSQSTRIARQAVRAGLKTIVFAQSRLLVEVITKYLKDVFDSDPRRKARVTAYRGGYLPTERRQAEQALRAGAMDCVISTSALELGVDIGALDVCILNGYPGSIAGSWQRLGRAGRRQRPTLGVLVATSMPLDQYVVRNPEFFLGASPEHARISPDQLLILLDHIRCAAFELPFREDERYGDQDIGEFLAYLADSGVLHLDHDQWHWIDDSYPANAVNLRSVADGNFVVVDTTDGKQEIIAEVDFSSAALTLYEGAIYMVQSRPWQVERLDWTGRKAYVRRTHVDYYTDSIDYTRLKVLERFQRERVRCGDAAHGEVHIVRRVTGYKKIRYYTHENIGYGPIDLPDQEMHTTAIWWQLDSREIDARFASRWEAMDGLIGATHALHTVAIILTMAEPRDLGRSVSDGAARWAVRQDGHGSSLEAGPGERADPQAVDDFSPCVFLYDNYPGGVGLSEPLYAERQRLIADARALIAGCDCERGCPGCIGPVTANEQRTDAKAGALVVLDAFGGSDGGVLGIPARPAAA
ncbi:MAG: DEAD/DEAH box helicase [Pseudomonadota bacterium]